MFTVGQVLDKFQTDVVPTLGERTGRDYIRHIEKLKQSFGVRPLKELRRSEVQEFLAIPKGPIQRNRAVAVLSSALTEAVNWGWVDSNVCKGIPRNKPKSRKKRVLTEQDFEELKRVAKPKIRLAIDLARYTGMLTNEIVTLRWSQVNEQRNIIRYRDQNTEKYVEVRISEKLRKVLNELKKIRKGQYVVGTRSGEPYTNEGFRAVWQRLMVGLDESGNDRITFHDIKRWAIQARSQETKQDVEDTIKAYPQFDETVRAEAAQMSQHYKVFYCLEQSIRKLITSTLESADGEDWWNKGKVNQEIRREVDLLVGREIDNGMQQRSERMIDYTTFGQLRQIIMENWAVFESVFTSRAAVAKVMTGLNLLRGPIAHCCPISEHEAKRLEFTVTDWFHTVLI